MLATQGRDTGIVDLRSGDTSARQYRTQVGPVVGGFGQQNQSRRLEPGVDLA